MPACRWSLADLHREVLTRGTIAAITGTTLWRWLDADAIRPWRHRSLGLSTDPQFAERAGPVLATLAALEHYLLAFHARYQAIATPVRWTFTRADLQQLVAQIAATAATVRPAA